MKTRSMKITCRDNDQSGNCDGKIPKKSRQTASQIPVKELQKLHFFRKKPKELMNNMKIDIATAEK